MILNGGIKAARQYRYVYPSPNSLPQTPITLVHISSAALRLAPTVLSSATTTSVLGFLATIVVRDDVEVVAAARVAVHVLLVVLACKEDSSIWFTLMRRRRGP